MNVVVLGAGSLGSTIGGTLALDGHHVTLIGRQAHVDAINANGLVLVTPDGEVTAQLDARTSAKGIAPADLVIVLSKSYDTETIVNDNRDCIGPETLVLSLQNGLGAEDLLCTLVEKDQVIGGKTYVGGMMLAPGKVQATTAGKWTYIGELDRPVTPRVEAVATSFANAGMPCAASDNIMSIIWSKLLINVATGAICGVTGLPYGPLYARKDLVELSCAAVQEGMDVAKAAGVELTYKAPIEAVEKARENLPGSFKPSILQSLEKGRKTEVDVINGAVVAYGKRYGIPTPINETLTALVHGVETHIELEGE